MGPCNDRAFSGFNRDMGRRGGMGRGFGRGLGYGPVTWTKEDEKKDLEAYKKDLEDELAGVKDQLKALDSDK
jgi:hypothetical protein